MTDLEGEKNREREQLPMRESDDKRQVLSNEAA